MKEIYYPGIQQLFKVEKKVVNSLRNMSPYEILSADIDNYKGDLKKTLKQAFAEIKNVTLNFFSADSNWYLKLIELENTLDSELESCENDPVKLYNFYFNRIGNLGYSVLNDVNNTCIAYSKSIEKAPIEEVSSINEYIFTLKSYVVNNHDIINNTFVVDKKSNYLNCPIVYHGNSSIMSDLIYSLFPLNMSVGRVDIVSVDESNILLMVKNGESAVTITINMGQDTVSIKYFIPEVYNVGEARSLPGIENKNVNLNDWVTGTILYEENLLTDVLFDLISRIPCDHEEMLFNGRVR